MQTRLAIKICVIFSIALLILIPISMVRSKIVERQHYLAQAKAAVTKGWTGPQLLVTPVIVIPYTQGRVRTDSGFYPNTSPRAETKTKILMPESSRVESVVRNKSLLKGIYEIPVYESDIELSATYSGEWLQEQTSRLKDASAAVEIGTPYISFHISDVRGIDNEPLLTINGDQLQFEAGSQLPHLPGGIHATLPDGLVTGTELNLSISLSLRGMESLVFVNLGDYAELSMRSNWPHPEFIGASLPGDRSINDNGFSARWLASKYTNSHQDLFAACLTGEQCELMHNSASGVRFIEPVDIYLQSERSVKYAMLFIGLSFVSFFIFETVKRARIHPIQYTFVGLAVAIFFLLLISLAEHIAFATAYAIAATCCCGLLLFYVRYVFGSLVSSTLFSTMIVGLYGLLYVIIQAEDYALVMGSMLVFVVLAGLMVVTRQMDWYELGGETKRSTG